jgi:hypothetical protein
MGHIRTFNGSYFIEPAHGDVLPDLMLKDEISVTQSRPHVVTRLVSSTNHHTDSQDASDHNSRGTEGKVEGDHQ